MDIPKLWKDKVKKCRFCGNLPVMIVWVSIFRDDKSGRAFCRNRCNNHFYVEVEGFNESRYIMWKRLVEEWNKHN